MSKHNMLLYTGNYDQLFGIKPYIMKQGRANGVRAFDVRNGSGLEFSVLQDRCMDIVRLSYKGSNCSYLGKSGVVAPEYYNEEGINFLRSFHAGFMTTCGLRNVGNACEENGEHFGLHGRISNTPAEEVSAKTEWIDDVPVLTMTGKMRESKLFGENLLLTRKITCKYNENKITIHNSVENLGFRREALMLLFHFNIGYPLLDEDAIFVAPTSKLTPRDSEAEKGKKDYNKCQKPTKNYSEQVFYHNLKADRNGDTQVAVINEKLELGVAIHFNKKQLFNFTQWKQMGEGEYVMGMEPCNCFVGGRTDPSNTKIMEYLDPEEIRDFDLTIEILNGKEKLDLIKKQVTDLCKK